MKKVEMTKEMEEERDAIYKYRASLLDKPETHARLKFQNKIGETHILWTDFILTDAFCTGVEYQKGKDLK